MSHQVMDMRELNIEEIDAVSGAGRDEVYLAGLGIASAGMLAGGTGVGVLVGFIGLAVMGAALTMPAE